MEIIFTIAAVNVVGMSLCYYQVFKIKQILKTVERKTAKLVE